MNRREQIEAYVVDSRAELQFGPMNDRALGATTEQWYDRLRFIPDDYLGECYRLAMDNHGTRSPLLPKEIVDQWHVVSARPGFRDKRVAQEKTCPNFCSSAGWYIVDSEGVMQKDFGSADYLYAKPCPIHRPQGFRRDPHSGEMGPRLTRPETMDQRDHPDRPAASVEGWGQAGKVARDVLEQLPPPPPDDDIIPF